MFRFSDHSEAGTLLGRLLEKETTQPNVVVLALRVEAEAVATSVAAVLESPLILQVPYVTPLPALEGSTIILVDDGFASVEELYEAAAAARMHRPGRLIAAAPVATREVSANASRIVDGFAFLATPRPFHSVGFWYEDTMRHVARAVFAGPARSVAHKLQPA